MGDSSEVTGLFSERTRQTNSKHNVVTATLIFVGFFSFILAAVFNGLGKTLNVEKYMFLVAVAAKVFNPFST